MSSLSLQVDGFLDSFRHRLLSGVEDPAVQEEVTSLRALWPGRAINLAQPEPHLLPACDHLGAALEGADTGREAGLALWIAALAPALRWTYSYPSNSRDRNLSSKVAFAQIAGQRGLQGNSAIHIGLTLIAPHVVYPAHHHPAVELYLVVSGTALWQSGVAEPIEKAPGSIILHPGNVVHAMTTFDEPLLAIWTWRGDLASPSVYVSSEADAHAS
jgi:quercetin dioxygenase-like cupin family protein